MCSECEIDALELVENGKPESWRWEFQVIDFSAVTSSGNSARENKQMLVAIKLLARDNGFRFAKKKGKSNQ